MPVKLMEVNLNSGMGKLLSRRSNFMKDIIKIKFSHSGDLYCIWTPYTLVIYNKDKSCILELSIEAIRNIEFSYFEEYIIVYTYSKISFYGINVFEPEKFGKIIYSKSSENIQKSLEGGT